jgi:hypothetical protein
MAAISASLQWLSLAAGSIDTYRAKYTCSLMAIRETVGRTQGKATPWRAGRKTSSKKRVRFPWSPTSGGTCCRRPAVIIKGEKLSNGLLAIFSQCEVVKQKAPSLVVREK